MEMSAIQKEADVNCGYGDYNELLPISRVAFVPAPAGRHRVNIMTPGEKRERNVLLHIPV